MLRQTSNSPRDYTIEVTSSAPISAALRECLTSAASATLSCHDVAQADLSIALVSDEQIARMNSERLGHEGPTDVITFDLRDDKNGAPARGVEGEIVMSLETARREAELRDHPLKTELALYTVHGVLHLLAHDDLTKSGAARMHATEDKILTELGYGPVYSRKHGRSTSLPLVGSGKSDRPCLSAKHPPETPATGQDGAA